MEVDNVRSESFYACNGLIGGVEVFYMEARMTDNIVTVSGKDEEGLTITTDIDLTYGNCSVWKGDDEELPVLSIWEEDPEDLRSTIASEEVVMAFPTFEIAKKKYDKVSKRLRQYYFAY